MHFTVLLQYLYTCIPNSLVVFKKSIKRVEWPRPCRRTRGMNNEKSRCGKKRQVCVLRYAELLAYIYVCLWVTVNLGSRLRTKADALNPPMENSFFNPIRHALLYTHSHTHTLMDMHMEINKSCKLCVWQKHLSTLNKFQ